MNPFFPEIRKNFGFGCMRFPMAGDQIDIPQVTEMVDTFLEAGFNYFDTARPYHNGTSEDAVRQCLTSRYPRDRFVLADKLSITQFETEEQILPLFESQLEKCGVSYFDFYLFHAVSAPRHERFKEMHAYDIVKQLKAEGKIRHIGLSFHDKARVLDKILTEVPELEFVQLQVNYVDWDDLKVQSRKCCEVCRKHGKPIMVMEPVKGGSLVNLPEAARKEITTGSPASLAIRYAASIPDVCMVLSGMSDLAQMQENVSFMKDFQKLTYAEEQTIERVRSIYQAQTRIPCTGCRYCVDSCYGKIDIPKVFFAYNDILEGKAGAEEAYKALDRGADRCVGCDMCGNVCPQRLNIRALMGQINKRFLPNEVKRPTTRTRLRDARKNK